MIQKRYIGLTRLLKFIRLNPLTTKEEIAESTGITSSLTRNHVQALQRLGCIKQIGNGPHAPAGYIPAVPGVEVPFYEAKAKPVSIPVPKKRRTYAPTLADLSSVQCAIKTQPNSVWAIGSM